MTKTRIIPSWQNAIVILSGTVVSLIIVIGLQWGRPVLVPIALAILLTFLLNPVVKKLQQRGLGRMPSVMVAVFAAGLTILLIGSLVVRQITILVADLPQNTQNIKAKVEALRRLGNATQRFSVPFFKRRRLLQRCAFGWFSATLCERSSLLRAQPARAPIVAPFASRHILRHRHDRIIMDCQIPDDSHRRFR
jgi:ABC-type multidrug transport system fused ATPase/permease subunit